jgi:hypothetical protein
MRAFVRRRGRWRGRCAGRGGRAAGANARGSDWRDRRARRSPAHRGPGHCSGAWLGSSGAGTGRGTAGCALRRCAPRGGRTPRLAGRHCRRRSRSAPGTGRGFLCHFGPGFVLLGAAGALPDLTRGRGVLARAPGFALGLFQALACALQLFLGDAHALLGDVSLQPRSLERLSRGLLFAACLLHRWARDAKDAQSHTSARRLPPRGLIHRICA